MNLKERVLCYFSKIRPYENVEHNPFSNGEFTLKAIDGNKTIEYCSKDKIEFKGEPLLQILAKRNYKDIVVPEIYAPSITIITKLPPFESGCDVSEEIAPGKWKIYTDRWTVENPIDYVKIFRDEIKNTTVGLSKTTGKFDFRMTAKLEGKILMSLPIPDETSALWFVEKWEKNMRNETRALDVKKYDSHRIFLP